MDFAFDIQKSESNWQKHGINFATAQLLWADPDRIQIPAKDVDEQRFMLIGLIEQKHRSAIITYRDGNIRIISVRRSRDEELKFMKAKTLDNNFDDGKNVLKHFDLSKATRPGLKQKRVNVDFPLWMVQRLDKEAKRLGVPRQSLIKVWIAEKLEITAGNV